MQTDTTELAGIDEGESLRVKPGVSVSDSGHRLRVFDGWRALSIALLGHMLPLVPASWQADASIVANGMVIFLPFPGFFCQHIAGRFGYRLFSRPKIGAHSPLGVAYARSFASA